MAALLSDVDALLYDALAALVGAPPDDAQPFAMVGRYAGRVTPEGVHNVCQGQYPAALLRWADESYDRDVDTTLASDPEDRARSSWSVIVVVEDPRAIDDGVVGASGVPGMHSLVDDVLTVCNAALLSGAWHERRIRAVRAAPSEPLTALGVSYGAEIAFEAIRVAPGVTAPDTSVPLTSLVGNEHLTDATGAPDPFTVFQSTV